MKDKQEQIGYLKSEVVFVALVDCSSCSKRQFSPYGFDSLECAQFFYDKGWRHTEEEILCPKCVEKQLKSDK